MQEYVSDIDRKAASLYDELLVALRKQESELAKLEDQIARTRSAMDALEVLNPSLARPANASGDLRGQEAVLRILQENVSRWMDVKQMVRELQRRNWMAPDAKAPAEAARISLRRLEEAGRIEKKKDGRMVKYRVKSGSHDFEPRLPDSNPDQGGPMEPP